MKKKRIILSVVSVLILAAITVFFNASKVSNSSSSSSREYKYFGEGASSVVSAGEKIYKKYDVQCPNGQSAEEFYEEEMKERLRDCYILDSNSGRKRNLSHIEVNAVATFLRTL